jgi:ApaG protein
MEMVELEGLSVVVDRVVYQSDMVTPEDRPHCFAYFITIRNNSNITVTIPELESGESFDYHSFHLFSGDWAVATGSYIGVDANGRSVITRIPEFRMDVPSHLS